MPTLGYEIPSKPKLKIQHDRYFEFKNINFRNINGQSTRIPIGGITCIVGVSGSGKTSFIKVVLSCFEKTQPIIAILLNVKAQLKK